MFLYLHLVEKPLRRDLLLLMDKVC